MHPKHDEDFYGWAMANASLLKQGKYQEVDMDKIIEELEEMGRSEKYQLINRFSILIAHLLKWQFQHEMAGHSWKCTIKDQRNKIGRLIQENPSLKSKIAEAISHGYIDAVILASKETGFPENHFPAKCPYTFNQIMDETFFPE
jgi:Domain of unknown function DUF29